MGHAMSEHVVQERTVACPVDADLAGRTRCLQKAIDEIAGAGGGVVRVAPGVWEVTTIYLRSGVRP